MSKMRCFFSFFLYGDFWYKCLSPHSCAYMKQIWFLLNSDIILILCISCSFVTMFDLLFRGGSRDAQNPKSLPSVHSF